MVGQGTRVLLRIGAHRSRREWSPRERGYPGGTAPFWRQREERGSTAARALPHQHNAAAVATEEFYVVIDLENRISMYWTPDR